MASIIKELEELVANGVIPAATAKDIESYYAAKKQPESSNLLTIFGALGAILVGLGIILIFAHNWDNFSRGTKTALAFLPLAAFQALTAYCIIKNKSSLWKDAAGTLLFFAVGASMALVAQIYNIPGDTGSFLFTWLLLCLPLIYILRSNTLAFLHIIFATYYAVEVGYFNPGRPWAYLFFIAALIPFYIKQIKETPDSNIVAIFSWLLPLSGIITFGAFLDQSDAFMMLMYVSFSCILYNIGMLPYLRKGKMRRNGYLCLGITAMMGLLLVSSFRWFWTEAVTDASPTVYYIAAWAVLFAVGTALIVAARNKKHPLNPFQAVTAIFPLIYLIGNFNDLIPTFLDNLLVLALGVACAREGIMRFDFKALNFGMIVISALIICRFFDTNISFAIRGLLFVAVGVGFFTANYILVKKKNINTVNTPQNEN